MHPATKKILICDLCGGDPQCAKVCMEGDWNCLQTVKGNGHSRRIYSRTPEETTKELTRKLYGEKGEEFV